jgi:4'-phosphopantetheinyl transferase
MRVQSARVSRLTPLRFRVRERTWGSMVSCYVPTVNRLIGSNPMEQRIPLTVVLEECPRDDQRLVRRTLENDQIHVWHACSPGYLCDHQAYTRLLTGEERARMERFHFEKDRQNFLFCRSMLKMLLASYLGTPPAELRFAYSAHGKPSLAVPSGNLEFNLSHSGGMVLFAFCQGRRIGVDVEHVRRNLDVHEIAERFFSAREQQELRQLPEPSQYDAFFHCWSRKEAFVKARGEGLSSPLDSFDVSVAPDEELVSLTTRPHSSEAARWMVRSLNVFPGYAAAVAVESASQGKSYSK